jgi:apolipoprotein D and lipocalin family protein
MKQALFLFMAAAVLAGCSMREGPETVASVDLDRYAGTWHEVARIPNWFQKKCASAATATYSPMPDGRIRVVNACRRADGRPVSISGTATPVPGSGNARLKVRFFGPFAGDYRVIGLDESGYRWAVVGGPSRNYLWFLSRTPRVSDTTFDHMLEIARKAGYDTSRIQRTATGRL